MDAAVNALQTKAERGFADHYETAKHALPGVDVAWVRELRCEAMRRYAARGLPHRRIEEWKYTDLRAALSEAYAPAPAVAEAVDADSVTRALCELAQVDAYRVVIVDGRLRPELSDSAAVAEHAEIVSLAQALDGGDSALHAALGRINAPDDDPLVGLNTALMTDGVVLRVRAGATPGKPLHVVHLHVARQPASLVPRNVVVIGEGAEICLIESFLSLSQAPSQRIAATEVDVGARARLLHVKIQSENAESAHLDSWMTRIGREADYRVLQLSLGAVLARNQLFVRFAGEGGSAHINAAAVARGRQHIDTTLVVDHAVPGCESRELFKAVLDERGRAVFQGKVIVRPGAQKTDGKQMAQALLLSDEAEFDSKPELEIFADDVACGHGSTSGQIDEDLLFYLRSRGIPEAEARHLLIMAFLGEALDMIEDDAMREALTALIRNGLLGRPEGRASGRAGVRAGASGGRRS